MLTPLQQKMIGVFYMAPITARTFWTDLVMASAYTYMTEAESIVYDEVEKNVRRAKILGRGVEYPVAQVDGFERKSFTPDIIKDSIPFKPLAAQTGVQPGQTVINGQIVNNADASRNNRIAQLKASLTEGKEVVSGEIILAQTYTPEHGKPVKFTKAKKFDIDGATIDSILVFLNDAKDAYQKETKTYPTHLFAGGTLFARLIKIAKKYGTSSLYEIKVTSKSGENGTTTAINIGGTVILKMPSAVDGEGNIIEKSSSLYLYHTNAVVPGYVGLTNVVNRVATIEKATELIRETSANEKTGDAETLAESGYAPILVNPTLIQEYAFTNIDEIEKPEPIEVITTAAPAAAPMMAPAPKAEPVNVENELVKQVEELDKLTEEELQTIAEDEGLTVRKTKPGIIQDIIFGRAAKASQE